MSQTCCIVGGGPAGIMTGFLLARAGVNVTVLEKHKDFFRDFRGDTVHPSTLQILHELGLLQDFLKISHQQVNKLGVVVGDSLLPVADFRYVPAYCKFIALMPQWDLLDFLSQRARQFATFDLRMEHEATGLIEERDCVRGVKVKTPDGPAEIRADLVIGCDGRRSITRQAAGLAVTEFGVPIDVLWFRISRRADDPDQVLGNVNYGKALILINRGDYFQSALIIRKGSFAEVKAKGLPEFQINLRRIAPYLGDRVEEVEDWDRVKLLSVQINRLQRWHRPGLLCIGDAAHAMSPAGGVGINLAIQDAVATANFLAGPLREGRMNESILGKIQKRREFPTRMTQRMQVRAHGFFARVFRSEGAIKAAWWLKIAVRLPGAQRFLARVVGIGFRPEHVKTS
jgi:2-polyprenyl-6-methoxyphenol hydroxylase-like FAD-dependent oxidoreductase